MIVKNEAHIIERCLASMVPHIDTYLISDTGSTDATIETIRNFMTRHGKPGEVIERPWVNFAHNRNEALGMSRARADFSMFIDADETLETQPDLTFPTLDLDAYEVAISFSEGSMTFYRLQLVRNSLPFRYEGVLHEAIVCDVPFRRGRIMGTTIRSHADSARNVGNIQEKYARDALVLEDALRREPNHARYMFYLGQSYKDAGQLEKSLDAYRKRIAMNGFDEETWYAELMCARLLYRLERIDEAKLTYLRAYERRPTRAESLCELARLYRTSHEYHLAHLFATRASELRLPQDVLFVETDAHGWRALDELSISAYYVGKYDQSRSVCEALLLRRDLPEKERSRVEKNLEFARAKVSR